MILQLYLLFRMKIVRTNPNEDMTVAVVLSQ